MKTKIAQRRNRRGVTTVEFAVTLPVLLVFVLGAFELGRANMMMHTSEAAAYEACRIGILPGAQANECIAAAQSILGTSGISQSQISVTPSNLNTPSDNVSVDVSVSFRQNSILAPLFMGNGSLDRTCVMTREQR